MCAPTLYKRQKHHNKKHHNKKRRSIQMLANKNEVTEMKDVEKK